MVSHKGFGKPFRASPDPAWMSPGKPESLHKASHAENFVCPLFLETYDVCFGEMFLNHLLITFPLYGVCPPFSNGNSVT